jgi:hypothetical protein
MESVRGNLLGGIQIAVLSQTDHCSRLLGLAHCGHRGRSPTAEPRDDWTQAVVVVVDATASATSTGTFTVPGYADGMEYQGFIRISEPREVEQPDQ